MKAFEDNATKQRTNYQQNWPALFRESTIKQTVSWRFEPSQPQRITSGLSNRQLLNMKQYKARTNRQLLNMKLCKARTNRQLLYMKQYKARTILSVCVVFFLRKWRVNIIQLVHQAYHGTMSGSRDFSIADTRITKILYN